MIREYIVYITSLRFQISNVSLFVKLCIFAIAMNLIIFLLCQRSIRLKDGNTFKLVTDFKYTIVTTSGCHL